MEWRDRHGANHQHVRAIQGNIFCYTDDNQMVVGAGGIFVRVGTAQPGTKSAFCSRTREKRSVLLVQSSRHSRKARCGCVGVGITSQSPPTPHAFMPSRGEPYPVCCCRVVGDWRKIAIRRIDLPRRCSQSRWPMSGLVSVWFWMSVHVRAVWWACGTRIKRQLIPPTALIPLRRILIVILGLLQPQVQFETLNGLQVNRRNQLTKTDAIKTHDCLRSIRKDRDFG